MDSFFDLIQRFQMRFVMMATAEGDDLRLVGTRISRHDVRDLEDAACGWFKPTVVKPKLQVYQIILLIRV